jgi:anaphase-promoting complex subunit 6
MREEEIEKLRGVVRDCVSKHLYSSAIFFADKVAGLTNDPADIYMQAQALFLGRHFRRAFHLLNASKIVLTDLRFRYLAAKCLEELKEWDQCLLMLGPDQQHNHSATQDRCEINVFLSFFLSFFFLLKQFLIFLSHNRYLPLYAFYEVRHMKLWKTVLRLDSG